MNICNNSIWIGIFVCLVGLVLFIMESKKQSAQEGKRFNVKKLIATILILGGVSFAAANQAAYGSCTRRSGACPTPAFPAGSTGYTCTNEYTQCSWTRNCVTVAGTMPWDSDCECKCTR